MEKKPSSAPMKHSKARIGFSGTGTNKQGDFHGTSTGVIVFDGMGQTTVIKSTQTDDASPDPESPGGFDVGVFDLSQFPGFRGEYTVNPDCTVTSKLLAPDGVTEIGSSAFVLVNGGREGWGIDTTVARRQPHYVQTDRPRR